MKMRAAYINKIGRLSSGRILVTRAVLRMRGRGERWGGALATLDGTIPGMFDNGDICGTK